MKRVLHSENTQVRNRTGLAKCSNTDLLIFTLVPLDSDDRWYMSWAKTLGSLQLAERVSHYRVTDKLSSIYSRQVLRFCSKIFPMVPPYMVCTVAVSRLVHNVPSRILCPTFDKYGNKTSVLGGCCADI